jgi:hypothetical protein
VNLRRDAMLRLPASTEFASLKAVMKHGTGRATLNERELFRIQRALESDIAPLERVEVLEFIRRARQIAYLRGKRDEKSKETK